MPHARISILDMLLDETIAAIATPTGEGGIGVVRISGRTALIVAGEIFRPASGIPVAGLPTHTAHYGFALDSVSEEHIDDGVLVVFRNPRSYTGEDTVEISCHGGTVVMRRLLESALRAGARLAEPGEFTKWAFLNGRIDLAQAEAVLDIIRARTDEALRVARRQFNGVLSTRIRMLREELIGIMARIESSIDFPDDVAEMEPEKLVELIRDATTHLAGLLETSERGRVYREGISAAITGRPNVGKSSLMNALLRDSRAIVTPIPGTTRDTIEESLSIQGIPITTIDTAGLRETEDQVEKIGVDRARKVIDEADLVLMVIDAQDGFTLEDEKLLSDLIGRKMIVVVNKTDLVTESDADALAGTVNQWLMDKGSETPQVVVTAAPSNAGIEALENAVAQTVLVGGISSVDGAIVSNVRHRNALERAHTALAQALFTARSGMAADFIAIDLRTAIDSIGLVTGETVSDDVIDRIFSDFCIGK
jgi:tRNA modification GTPase